MGPFNAFWLATTIQLASPLIFAASGEMVAERAGILNIGLEGMMLVGAFAGYWATLVTGNPWLGVLAGLGEGLLLAALMAVLSVQLRSDQIVVGVGLNILALGVTNFAFRQFLGGNQALIRRFSPLSLPVLSNIPVVGDALFRQIPLVDLAFVAALLAWFVLYRTRLGLSLRAAGELPAAADTAGSSVSALRWVGTLVAGALAGVGGSFLSISLGIFVQGMTGGRGFLAIAAVIFGRWRPLGTVLACLLFGGVDALQLSLQGRPAVPREVWLVMLVPLIIVAMRMSSWRTASRQSRRMLVFALVAIAGLALFLFPPSVSLPSQLWTTAPYVLSLLVLAGAIGRHGMPSALSIPYRRDRVE